MNGLHHLFINNFKLKLSIISKHIKNRLRTNVNKSEIQWLDSIFPIQLCSAPLGLNSY